MPILSTLDVSNKQDIFLSGHHAGCATNSGPPRLPIPVPESGLDLSNMRSILPAAEHRAGVDKTHTGTFRKGIWTTM